jgi:hypothetical protein
MPTAEPGNTVIVLRVSSGSNLTLWKGWSIVCDQKKVIFLGKNFIQSSDFCIYLNSK